MPGKVERRTAALAALGELSRMLQVLLPQMMEMLSSQV